MSDERKGSYFLNFYLGTEHLIAQEQNSLMPWHESVLLIM